MMQRLVCRRLATQLITVINVFVVIIVAVSVESAAVPGKLLMSYYYFFLGREELFVSFKEYKLVFLLYAPWILMTSCSVI